MRGDRHSLDPAVAFDQSKDDHVADSTQPRLPFLARPKVVSSSSSVPSNGSRSCSIIA